MIRRVEPQREPLPTSIATSLETLRRGIRRYIWAESLASVVVWLGIAFWASLLIDWFFEPPVALRAVLLAVIFFGTATILYRLLIDRLRVQLSDTAMATLLERRFTHLDDSLLTAVLPADETQGETFYSEMYRRTCREAENRITTLRLDDIFDRRPLRRVETAAALLLVGITLFGSLFPDLMKIWGHRSLALSTDIWPRHTRLALIGFTNGVRKVARGSDVEIVVGADTFMPKIPSTVEIRYREEGGVRGRATMQRVGSADPAKDPFQEYSYTRRNVLSPLSFDVYGGDDSLKENRIEVVDSPTVTQWMLECTYPTYMERPVRSFSGSGIMQLPFGTSVSLHATANKRLVRVQIDAILEEKNEATTHILEKDDLDADRMHFTLALPPLKKDTTLLVTLWDEDGIKSREPERMGLAVQPDETPQVAALLDGIGSAITPQAKIVVTGRAADDYGLAKIWFEHAIDQQDPTQTAIPLPSHLPTECKIDGQAFDITSLGIKAGQKLQLAVKAQDAFNLGKSPNIGVGDRWTFDIVTPDQLRAILEAREMVLRQRFEAIIQETIETRDLLARMDLKAGSKPSEKSVEKPTDASLADKETKKSESEGPAMQNRDKKEETKGTATVQEPGDDSAGAAEPLLPERQLAMHIMRVQRAFANSQKNAQELLDVAEGIGDIRKQLVNNQIDTVELKERLEQGIGTPLHQIAETLFPELEQRLDAFQKALEETRDPIALHEAARLQTETILLAMQKVLSRMIEMEDYNQAVELLREIIKLQDQLDKETQERHKQKLREMLEE